MNYRFTTFNDVEIEAIQTDGRYDYRAYLGDVQVQGVLRIHSERPQKPYIDVRLGEERIKVSGRVQDGFYVEGFGTIRHRDNAVNVLPNVDNRFVTNLVKSTIVSLVEAVYESESILERTE